MAVYTVPNQRGDSIPLESSFIDGLSALEVVWSRRFEDEGIGEDIAVEKEAQFYKGAPPQWLNFYWAEREGTPCVKRDMFEEIKSKIQEYKHTTWSIRHVQLFHQPGSGGSTLAMQILWDLRKELRCAKVKDSTPDTKAVAQQVVQLFNAGGAENQNTVLLLLDNSDDPMFAKNLEHRLFKEMKASRISTTAPVAIVLNCVRQLEDTSIRSLKTSLSETEKAAFKKKHDEISRRHSGHAKFHAFNIMLKDFSEVYVTEACESLKTVKTSGPQEEQLLALLVLVNSYAPGSYISHKLCCLFFGNESNPLDKFSLEEKMKPFTDLLVVFSTQERRDRSEDKQVRMAHPMIADKCLQMLTVAGVTRSDTTLKLLTDICRDTESMDLMNTIIKMLTKRETKQDKDSSGNQVNNKSEKDRFSRLIEDIKVKEGNKEMCVSVLRNASEKFAHNAFLPQALARFYYIEMSDYTKAEKWAKTAIQRDEGNSFIRDTLGQVLKNHFKKTKILKIGKQAIKAFEDEAEAAMKEQAPEMKDDGVTKISTHFNNRGYFGFMQVADTIFPFLTSSKEDKTFLIDLRGKVERRFEFFEKYLTYSKPSIVEDEPRYFRPSVEECYRKYVTLNGQKQTDLQRLKEKEVSTFAGLLHAVNGPLSLADLEWITGVLSRQGDADSELMYVLANILLSERTTSSTELRQLDTLWSILKKQWGTHQSPEFYLLVLLLFWPNGQQVRDDSPDIQECIKLMQQSFKSKYQSVYRSRFLVPLFFLKEGEGLQKVLRTSQSLLDQILKESAYIPGLCRVQGEVMQFTVFAVIGSRMIEVSPQNPASVRCEGKVSFYLGFTIQGPVAYDIRYLRA